MPMKRTCLSMLPIALSALLSTPGFAQQPADPATPVTATDSAIAAAVVPPGQEALIEQLLTVPGQSAPQAISVKQDHIIALWSSDASRKVILRHKDASLPVGAALLGRTARFMVLGEGAVDAAYTNILLTQVRAHEAAFQWQVPQRSARTGGGVDANAEEALQALIQRAGMSLRIGERDKALAAAQAGKTHATARSLTRARLGALLDQLGDKDGAEIRDQAIAALAARAAGAPAARLDHLAATALVKPDEAAAAGSKLVAGLKGEAACAWVALADTLVAAGKREAAQKLAMAVAFRAPQCKNAWLTAGGLFAHVEGGSEPSLKFAEQALAAIPDDVDLLAMKASALHGLWRNDEAAVLWERVLARDLRHPGTLGLLATACTQGEQVTDDAWLKRFADRVAANPDDKVARYIKGTIHYYRGDFEDVLKYLEPLIDDVPNEPRIYLYTAMSNFELGRVEQADKLLARVAALVHDDPDYYYCRSVVNRTRDFEQSLRDLETFVRLSRDRQNRAAKVAKVERELEIMRSGRLPTAWDMWPAPLRYGVPLAGLLLLLGLGAWLVRRR